MNEHLTQMLLSIQDCEDVTARMNITDWTPLLDVLRESFHRELVAYAIHGE